METSTIVSRARSAWNVFKNRDPTQNDSPYYGYGTTVRPDRPRIKRGGEKTIATAVFNRIAMDAMTMDIREIICDENGKYLEDVDSSLNNCFKINANDDQSARAFKHDLFLSLLGEGYLAIVPTDTIGDPNTGAFDVEKIRTAQILEWKPKRIRVRVYDENTGRKRDVWVDKSTVAIVESPFYPIINEPNSTLQRLIRKLNLLDVTDEQMASGKLDLIIQLPFATRTESKKKQADKRRKDIEMQLVGSKYGVAYVDATEKITQLNRPLENQLLKQVEYLTNQFYSQLGMTETILNGTADEKTMRNYENRTVKPLVFAAIDAMKWKFLSKTARSRGHDIQAFVDPFRYLTVGELADTADKLSRNEVISSNEVRQGMGLKPSSDPKADMLINSNMPQYNNPMLNGEYEEEFPEEGSVSQNG